MFDALLKSVLLAEPVPWPGTATVQEEERFLEFAQEHCIQPLLYHQLKESGSLERWPETIRSSLRKRFQYQVSVDILWQSELRDLLCALAASDVFPLLIKGTPLSYTHYPSPGLRPRSDTDLLIPERQRKVFDDVLSRAGYSRSNTVSGKLISYQVLYKKRGPGGFGFAIDAHWKISNVQLFSDLLPYEELKKRELALPSVSKHARTLSPANALLLACIHRVAHHENSERLIWLYDIHLIAQKMDRSEFEEFAEMAARKQVRLVCLSGLKAAMQWFHTNSYEDVIERTLQGADSYYEPSAQYVDVQLRAIDLLKLDFKRLRGRQKLQYLKELLFPSANYMFRRYSVSNPLFLPALYFHRAWTGYWKFVRRGPSMKRPSGNPK